jgi:hypothetical protein
MYARKQRLQLCVFCGWFVGLVESVQEIFVPPWLIWSAQYKIFFPPVHYFNFFVPIAQHAGQAEMLGRLSLSIYVSLVIILQEN